MSSSFSFFPSLINNITLKSWWMFEHSGWPKKSIKQLASVQQLNQAPEIFCRQSWFHITDHDERQTSQSHDSCHSCPFKSHVVWRCLPSPACLAMTWNFAKSLQPIKNVQIPPPFTPLESVLNFKKKRNFIFIYL